MNYVKYLSIAVTVNTIIIILLIILLLGSRFEPIEYGDKTIGELKVECTQFNGSFSEYHLVHSSRNWERPRGRYADCERIDGNRVYQLFDLIATKWVLVK